MKNRLKKFKLTRSTINIKRRIDLDKSDNGIDEFIFKNINYRRKVYNDFVDESRKYTFVLDFNPIKFKTEYFNSVEKPNHLYEIYCTGISEQVSKDVKRTLKCIKTNKHWDSKLQYRKFDKFRSSFKVHTKEYFRKLKHGPDHFISRVRINSYNEIRFRVRDGVELYISLYENLFNDTEYIGNDIYPYYIDKENQYYFREEDIKEICFIHEFGKFYIALSISGFYINQRNIKDQKVVGIDLGIRNPLTCYNGDEFIKYRMSDKELARIHYLERRISRLQHIMDKKLRSTNFEKSKNYMKVHKKFRISWRKIYNIRKNWRNKLAKKLCLQYDIIIIDKFTIPDAESHKGYPTFIKRFFYSTRTFHALCYIY